LSRLGFDQTLSLEDSMTMMPSMRSAALIAALVAAPALALAQSASAPAPAATAATPSASAPTSSAERAAEARVEARIKQLHAQLRITPAEDAQWSQFADVMRDNARAIDEAAAQRADQLPTMNALQDLQSYEQLAEAHVERVQKLIPAFEALYNAMSPQQKEIADRVFRGRAESHAAASPKG
jgi:periplasmic protein CpxP/Spy